MFIKRLVGYGVLVFVASCIGLVLMEVALRLLGYGPAAELNTRNHDDPYVPRHAQGTFGDRQFRTVANFDENGFRRHAGNCAKADAKRVLIVGDSNIEAIFVNDGEDLSAQLARRLNVDACFKVDAYGVSGYGPDQTYFAIEKLTDGSKYDVVIFYVFADNDAGDLIRNNNRVEDGHIRNRGYCYPSQHWLLDHSAVARLVRGIIYDQARMYIDWNPVRHSMGDDDLCQSPDVPRTKDPLADLFLRAQAEYGSFVEDRVSVYMGDRYDIEFACGTNAGAMEAVRHRIGIIARSFFALSQERGFRPIFLIMPSEFDVTDNHDINPTLLRNACGNYKPDNLTMMFVSQIPNSVETISLFRAFDGCSECYFSAADSAYDNHWNSTGIGKAADILAGQIVGNAKAASSPAQ